MDPMQSGSLESERLEEPCAVVISPDRSGAEEAAAFLAEEGWRVARAATGAEGLELAWGAQLLVVDLGVAEPDGYQILRELRWNPGTAEIPVVVAGAREDDASAIFAEALGCPHYEDLGDVDALRSRLSMALRGETDEGGSLGRRRLIDVVREYMLHSGRDDLTGVHNPSYVRRALENELDRCRRYDRPLALIVLDLKDFARFNETHGRIAGNRLLRAVGEVLQNAARRTDSVGRWEGDAFGILLPETNAQQAQEAAVRFLSQIAGLGREAGLAELGAHVGIAACPEDGDEAEALIAAAQGRLRQSP